MLGELERRPRVGLRRGEIADLVQAPRESPLDLDAVGKVVPDLGECRSKQIGADVKALPERLDPRESGDRDRALLAGGKSRDDVLEQSPRALGVSCLEMAFPGLERPPPAIGVRGRREPPRLFPELCSGLRCPSRPGPAGSGLHGRRHVVIGTGGGEREVPRALIGIVHDLRQARVQRAPPRRRRARIDDRAEERMREPDPAVGDLDDTGRARLLDTCGPSPLVDCRGHERDRRT